MKKTVKNIWHICEHASFIGGIEQNLYALASGLKACGYRQQLVYKSERNEPEFIEAFDFVTNLGAKNDLHKSNKRLLPDVIIIHKPINGLSCKALSEYAPVIRVVHDHDLICPRKHKYFPVSKRICHKAAGFSCYRHGCFLGKDIHGQLKINKVSDRLAELSDCRYLSEVVVASRYMKAELQLNGIAANKITIIAPSPGKILKPKKKIKAGSILYVGQLIRGKGVDLLLAALDRVKIDFSLTIAGDGNMRDELEELVVRYNLEDKVNFVGSLSHDEILNLYAKAAIVAFPSRWPEPFGMVGVEAMASAVPVVGFNVGGVSDWLWHGINGLAAREADVTQFADNMELLLTNPKLAFEMGQSGRALYERYFQDSDYIKKFVELFKNL